MTTPPSPASPKASPGQMTRRSALPPDHRRAGRGDRARHAQPRRPAAARNEDGAAVLRQPRHRAESADASRRQRHSASRASPRNVRGRPPGGRRVRLPLQEPATGKVLIPFTRVLSVAEDDRMDRGAGFSAWSAACGSTGSSGSRAIRRPSARSASRSSMAAICSKMPIEDLHGVSFHRVLGKQFNLPTVRTSHRLQCRAAESGRLPPSARTRRHVRHGLGRRRLLASEQATTYQSLQIPAGHRPIELDGATTGPRRGSAVDRDRPAHAAARSALTCGRRPGARVHPSAAGVRVVAGVLPAGDPVLSAAGLQLQMVLRDRRQPAIRRRILAEPASRGGRDGHRPGHRRAGRAVPRALSLPGARGARQSAAAAAPRSRDRARHLALRLPRRGDDPRPRCRSWARSPALWPGIS